MMDFEKGILNPGCFGPIRAVMEKAERGEPVTVAFLGGSITQGSLSSTPQTCYAYLVYQWWQQTFPQSKVTYINAGIGGTGSYYGVARVEEHVLRYAPDFVLTEFAVNDMGLPLARETYEGLVRRILTAPCAPALLLMHNVCYDTGYNAEADHLPVAKHYSLPCVSVKHTVYPEVAAGNIPNRDITPDDLHPNDAGHALVARTVTHLLEKIKASSSREMPPALPAPLTANRFQNTVLLQNRNCDPILEGFTADPTPQNHITETFRHGFTAWKPGDKITFRTQGRCFGVLYRKSVRQPAPIAQITVDGTWELNANFEETWGDCTYLQPLTQTAGAGEHTVTIELKDTGREAAVPFYLIGLAVSKGE